MLRPPLCLITSGRVYVWKIWRWTNLWISPASLSRSSLRSSPVWRRSSWWRLRSPTNNWPPCWLTFSIKVSQSVSQHRRQTDGQSALEIRALIKSSKKQDGIFWSLIEFPSQFSSERVRRLFIIQEPTSESWGCSVFPCPEFIPTFWAPAWLSSPPWTSRARWWRTSSRGPSSSPSSTPGKSRGSVWRTVTSGRSTLSSWQPQWVVWREPTSAGWDSIRLNQLQYSHFNINFFVFSFSPSCSQTNSWKS